MIELKHDSIEDTDEYRSIVEEVDRKVEQIIEDFVEDNVRLYGDVLGDDFVRSLSTSHRFAYEKKKMLKDEYGIEWKSVIEMNPDVNID